MEDSATVPCVGKQAEGAWVEDVWRDENWLSGVALACGGLGSGVCRESEKGDADRLTWREVGVVSPGVSTSVSTTVVVLVLVVLGTGDPVKMVARSSTIFNKDYNTKEADPHPM